MGVIYNYISHFYNVENVTLNTVKFTEEDLWIVIWGGGGS